MAFPGAGRLKEVYVDLIRDFTKKGQPQLISLDCPLILLVKLS